MTWKFTVTIPDTIKDAVATAFAEVYDYEHNNDGMTRQEFTYMKIKQYISDIYKSNQVKIFNTDKAAVILNADAYTKSIAVTKSIIVV